MTTKYTQTDLSYEARRTVAQVWKETGKPASLDHWFIVIDGSNVALCVVIRAYDGLRQRNIAI